MQYLKMLAMVVATVLSGLVAALAVPPITSQEWINIAILGVGALGVFAAPNVPGANYTKIILAALAAVLTLAVNLIAGGLDLSEVLQLVLAALGAVGVYALGNERGPQTVP